MNENFDTRHESWAADFESAPEARELPVVIRARVQNLLAEFMGGACENGCDPTQIGEAEVRLGLLGRVAALELEPRMRAAAPLAVSLYLRFLGREGRVANARHLANFALALKIAFQSVGKPGGGGKPIRRGTSKLSLNAPCPCGSGKKWKRCCRLGLSG